MLSRIATSALQCFDLPHDLARLGEPEGERTLGERHELQRARVARRQFGQPPMKQVAAGQLARVAERHQHGA